jgi:anti-sigma B factor antagonist
VTVSAPLSVDVQPHGARTRVVLHGELDRSTAARLAAALEEAERTQPDCIDLDLAELEFIDAGGLRTILQAARRAQGDERTFVVSNPSPVVRRLFALTAIDRTVGIRVESGRGRRRPD